jgi:hypothetical protein
MGFRHRRIRQRVPVSCGQLIYIKDKKIIDIEGEPDSPLRDRFACGPRNSTRAKYRHIIRARRLASSVQVSEDLK